MTRWFLLVFFLFWHWIRHRRNQVGLADTMYSMRRWAVEKSSTKFHFGLVGILGFAEVPPATAKAKKTNSTTTLSALRRMHATWMHHGIACGTPEGNFLEETCMNTKLSRSRKWWSGFSSIFLKTWLQLSFRMNRKKQIRADLWRRVNMKNHISVFSLCRRRRRHWTAYIQNCISECPTRIRMDGTSQPDKCASSYFIACVYNWTCNRA